jgi:putative endonuclease
MAENKRIAAERRGHRAETVAAWALRLKGFRIAARRYKTKGGEVDIIARRGALVVMVEVKARPTLTQAHEALTPTAWRRIETAGDHWLARQSDHGKLSIRYDLVAVLPRRWPVHVAGVWT